MWVKVLTHALGWFTIYKKCEPVPKDSFVGRRELGLWCGDWKYGEVCRQMFELLGVLPCLMHFRRIQLLHTFEQLRPFGSSHFQSKSLCYLTPSFRSVWFVVAFTFEFSGPAWAAMVSKHKGSPGFRDTSGPNKSWHMPSRLMPVRNGYVSSVPKPMCGPGGVADDVCQQVCRRSTNRLSLRRAKDSLQGHLL